MRTLMFAALMTLAACGGEAPTEAPAEEPAAEAAKTEEAPAAEEAAAEGDVAANTEAAAAAEYVCPMHLTQKSAEPGDCAECGMKLEKKTAKAEAPAPAAEGAEKKDAHGH